MFFFSSKSDRKLSKSIKALSGVTPGNIELYKLATQHRSIAKQNNIGFRESNERLEYLGDAILFEVEASGVTLIVKQSGESDFVIGQQARVALPTDHWHVYPSD